MDVREFQVAYAKESAGLLQARKFRRFLGKSYKRDFLAMLGLLPQENVLDRQKARRNMYFEQPGLLERIASNIFRCSIMHGDIAAFEYAPDSFQKLYLSNAPISSCQLLSMLPLLRRDGLVYVSSAINAHYLGEHLRLNEQLTSIARHYESECSSQWQPLVYRKE